MSDAGMSDAESLIDDQDLMRTLSSLLDDEDGKAYTDSCIEDEDNSLINGNELERDLKSILGDITFSPLPSIGQKRPGSQGSVVVGERTIASPATSIQEQQDALAPAVKQIPRMPMINDQVGEDARIVPRLFNQEVPSTVAPIQEKQAAFPTFVKQMFKTPMFTGQVGRGALTGAPSLDQKRTPTLEQKAAFAVAPSVKQKLHTPVDTKQVGRSSLTDAPSFEPNRASLVPPSLEQQATLPPIEQELLPIVAFSRADGQGRVLGEPSFGKAMPTTMLTQGTAMIEVARVPSIGRSLPIPPGQVGSNGHRAPMVMPTGADQPLVKRRRRESEYVTSIKRRRLEIQPLLSESRPVQNDNRSSRHGPAAMVTGADQPPLKRPSTESDYVSSTNLLQLELQPYFVIVGHYANTKASWLPLATKKFKEWTEDKAITSVKELNELKQRMHQELQKELGADNVPRNWQGIPFLAPDFKWRDKEKKYFKETKIRQECTLPDKNRTVAKLITDDGVIDLERNRRLRARKSLKFRGSAAKVLTDALRETVVWSGSEPSKLEVTDTYKSRLGSFMEMYTKEPTRTELSRWLDQEFDRQVITFVNTGWDKMMKEYEKKQKRKEGIVHDVSIDSCIQPGEQDVLCGRDKYSHEHIGNKLFRFIIAMNRERYQRAAHRDQKTRITKEIVESIASSGGRFLRQNPQTKEWEDVTEPVGHEKVSHALRRSRIPPESVNAENTVARKKPNKEENQISEDHLQQGRHLGR